MNERPIRSNIQLIYNIVVATQNPLAPKICERAHSSLFDLGRMLAAVPGFDDTKVNDVSAPLIDAITTATRDKEETKLNPHSPEFMVILISMLRTSLEGYLANLPDIPMPPEGPTGPTH